VKTPLIELAYMGPVSWFSAFWNCETVVLDDREHYQKGGVRNRCYIAGPNGVQRLSIPLVKGKHQRTPLRAVRIAYEEPWQRLHWRSIRAAYGNAPFFEHYSDRLAPFFEKRFEFLFDLNLELLRFFLEKLKWPGQIAFPDRYYTAGEWTQGPDWRNACGGAPQNVPDWFAPKPYAQVFQEKHDFLPNLSVLDLLFCCGKEGIEAFRTA
jgi:WbqC-like protein family